MSTLILVLKIFSLGSLSFLILVFSGYGLTRLLLPRRHGAYAILVMPLVGYAFLVTIATYLGWVGLATRDHFWVPLLLALLISLSAAIFAKDKSPLIFLPSELIYPLAVAAMVFFIGLLPLVVTGQLTTIGYNGDAVFTSLLAKYLQGHSLAAPPVSFDRPYTIQTWYLDSGYWLGFTLFQAFIDQVFHLEPYQSFSLLTALLLSLIPLTCYFFCCCLLGLEEKVTRLTLVLLTINAALFWLHYDDFAANIVSISLILLALSLLFFIMEEYNLRTALLAALTLSAFLNTYPWMLGYLLGPIGIYLLYLWRWQKKPLSELINTVVKTAFFALCFNPLVIIRLVRQLSWLSRLPKAYLGGNITEFISLTELYGLSHHRLADEGWYLSPYFQILILFIFAGALALTFYGLIIASGKQRALLLSLAIPSILNFFYLKYLADYPYGFFKNLSMSITITMMLLPIGLFSLYGRIKRHPWPGLIGNRFAGPLLGLPLAFAGAYILINIYTLVLLTKVTSKSMTLNLSALKDLATKVKSLHIPGPIYLKDDKETRMLWLTYFLESQPLALNNLSPLIYYEMYPFARPKDFYQDGISQDYVLVKRERDMLPTWAEKVLYENREYQLLKKKPEVLYHLDLKPRPLLLHNRDKVKITVQPERIAINSRSYNLPGALSAQGQELGLRFFAPRGAGYVWEQDGIKKTIYLGQDTGKIKKEIGPWPFQIEITNLSPRTMIFPWLEITGKKDISAETFMPPRGTKEDKNVIARSGYPPESVGGTKQSHKIATPAFGELAMTREGLFSKDSILSYFPEPMLPDTDFYIVAGWYDLDLTDKGEKGRWTGANAICLFRNPYKKSLLKIKGQVSHWAIEGKKVPRVQILLNGFRLDNFIPQDHEFVRELILDKSNLGNSQWCELSFGVDKTITPHQYDHSGDRRELGIKITHIQHTDYYNPPEKLFPGSEFYLVKGWHELESKKTKDQAYRWTKAKARTLFRNPHKKSLLRLRGELPYLDLNAPSRPNIKLLLNGNLLANFVAQDKNIRKNFVLEGDSLGSEAWCELELAIDKTVIPKMQEGKEDRRELGIKITRLDLHDYFAPPERVLPDSTVDLYAITGWHELEYGNKIARSHPRRWTEAQALALLKNPGREGTLGIAGTLPPISFPSPPIVQILLRGEEIDRFVPAGKEFYRELPVTKDLLGPSPWLELSFSTNQVFIPDAHYKTGDHRELGICITRVDFREGTLGSQRDEPVVDFGKPEAHKYIANGWSWDETWPDGRDFNWACNKESILKLNLPKVSDYVMNLRMIPFRGPTNSSQQMNIYLNGHLLTGLRLINDQWLEYQVFIPYDYLSTLETNTFRLGYKYLGSVPGDSRSLAAAFDRISFTKTGLQRLLPDSALYMGQGWYELEEDPETGRYWRKGNNGAEFWLKKTQENTYLSLKGELISYPEGGSCQVQLWTGEKELGRIKTVGRAFAGEIRITPELFSDSTWLKLNITTTRKEKRVSFKVQELRLQERVLPDSPARVIRGWSDLEIVGEQEDYWRWTEDAAEADLPGSKEGGYWQLLGEILPLKAYPTPPQIKLELNGKEMDSFVPLNPQFLWQYSAPKEPVKLRLSIDQTVIPDSFYHNGDQRRVGLKIKGLRHLNGQEQLPGLLINLGEKRARDYLRAGWSSDERGDNMTSFVWATAKEALLQFSLPRKADYFLNLRLMPFTFPGASQQTTKVYLNDKFLADIPLIKPEWQTYQLFIRTKYLARKGPNTLRLVHSYTQIPSQVLASQDQRDLAVAYDYISFIPAPATTKPPLLLRLKRKLHYLWTRSL